MIGPRWVPPALAQRAGPEVLALVITILIGIPAWTGVFVGLTGAAATTPSSSPAATETAPVTTPVTRPTASPDDGPPPSPNAGLLRVAIVLDGRISESGARLKSRLDAPGLDAEGALYELGLLNGIATDGLGVADRLAADPATATIGSQLGAAYRDLREAAVPGCGPGRGRGGDGHRSDHGRHDDAARFRRHGRAPDTRRALIHHSRPKTDDGFRGRIA
jgi:hypothetical protein